MRKNRGAAAPGREVGGVTVKGHLVPFCIYRPLVSPFVSGEIDAAGKTRARELRNIQFSIRRKVRFETEVRK